MVYYKLQENECGMKTVGSPAPLILSAEGNIGMKGRPIKFHHTFLPRKWLYEGRFLNGSRAQG